MDLIGIALKGGFEALFAADFVHIVYYLNVSAEE